VTSLVAIGHMVQQSPKLLDELSLNTLKTFVVEELLNRITVRHQLLFYHSDKFVPLKSFFSPKFICIICSLT